MAMPPGIIERPDSVPCVGQCRLLQLWHDLRCAEHDGADCHHNQETCTKLASEQQAYFDGRIAAANIPEMTANVVMKLDTNQPLRWPWSRRITALQFQSS